MRLASTVCNAKDWSILNGQWKGTGEYQHSPEHPNQIGEFSFSISTANEKIELSNEHYKNLVEDEYVSEDTPERVYSGTCSINAQMATVSVFRPESNRVFVYAWKLSKDLMSFEGSYTSTSEYTTTDSPPDLSTNHMLMRRTSALPKIELTGKAIAAGKDSQSGGEASQNKPHKISTKKTSKSAKTTAQNDRDQQSQQQDNGSSSTGGSSSSGDENRATRQRVNLPSQTGCIQASASNKKGPETGWVVFKNSCPFDVKIKWCDTIGCKKGTGAATIPSGNSYDTYASKKGGEIHINLLNACQTYSGNDEVYINDNGQCWANVLMK